jgi:hypothetical protein
MSQEGDASVQKTAADGQVVPDSKAVPKHQIPFMASLDDAAALYQREKDPFYIVAFMLQHWLCSLVERAIAEYVEKKNPKERSLQRGEACRTLLELLEFLELESGKRFRYLLSVLLRFSGSDDAPGNSLRRALVPLSIEHRCTGDYFGPKTLEIAKLEKEGNELARRTVVRWCDWVDAAVHLRVHRHWHFAPDCFDPDPEKRQLAELGKIQRHIAELDPRAQAAWLWDFSNAALRFKDSPKWAALGKSMGSESEPSWPYADVDTLVIAFWPMVKGYNWTYRDLLNVIRPALKRPKAYPCEREQDFATYCANVLGLRKTGKGLTAKNGRPAGYEIAVQLSPALARALPGGPSSTRP